MRLIIYNGVYGCKVLLENQISCETVQQWFKRTIWCWRMTFTSGCWRLFAMLFSNFLTIYGQIVSLTYLSQLKVPSDHSMSEYKTFIVLSFVNS